MDVDLTLKLALKTMNYQAKMHLRWVDHILIWSMSLTWMDEMFVQM